MSMEAARALNYDNSAYYGTAAPAQAPVAAPVPDVPERVEKPVPQERVRPKERSKTAQEATVGSISLFAVFGTLLAGILMVFVVLAQINYNEIASETVRLRSQQSGLEAQRRKLEIEFESAIDIKEVERVARDVIGMSRQNTDQAAIAMRIPADSAQILSSSGETGGLRGFGSFISSLLEYFSKK